MSSHPDFRAPTGRPRGPEAHGAKQVDPDRDALRDQLRAFEARADKDDPEQQEELARLREETRELEYLRGVWDKRGLPGVTRDWNAPVKPGAPTPKEMLLEFQEWKMSVERERCLLSGLPLPPALEAGAPAAKLLEAAPAEAAQARATTTPTPPGDSAELAAPSDALPLDPNAAPCVAGPNAVKPALADAAPAAARKRGAKPITWAHALTKQQLLALLDRQSEADIWAKVA